MPWKDVLIMDQRREVVLLAGRPGANKRELARRWGIAPKTLYKWLDRYEEFGEAGLADRSRRPRSSPERTPVELERRVLTLHEENPYWGARKLRELMKGEVPELPARSTVHEILRRHDCLIGGKAEAEQGPFKRFEHPHPNDLWQMDFKGYVRNERGLCHPLTVLDDHSRFSLCLAACNDEQYPTVQKQLIATFKHYGLPLRMTMDNGPPWGGGNDGLGYTMLTVWLLQLGIRVSHSRPRHPQTQGKDERFHRTLKVELLQHRRFIDNVDAQSHFDGFRDRYNTKRPHEALGMAVPISRYQASQTPYPEVLPVVEYLSADKVYKVDSSACITVKGYRVKIGKAFIGQRIALRPTNQDGLFGIWFSRFDIGQLDLRLSW